MNIYLDTETIPTQRKEIQQRIQDAVHPPANYTNADTIAKWWDTKGALAKDRAWRDTALSGNWGEVVAIGIGCDHKDEIVVFDDIGTGEAHLLHMAFDYIKTTLAGQHPTYIGHKISFDLRFLYKRAAVHGVKLPSIWPHKAKPWNGRYVDTEYEWTAYDDKDKHISLDELCRVLDIRPLVKDEIDGSGVWDAWATGNKDKVIEHCRADVDRVRQVWRRLGQI